MFNINVDKRSVQNLEELVTMLETLPAKIQMANVSATEVTIRKTKENIAKRSKSISRAIKVEASQRGDFGTSIKIYSSGPRGGHTGGRRASGKYSILIASRIFLNSEQGKIGRRAFRLPEKIAGTESNYYGGYKISHTSGRWVKGRRLQGPLSIPALGKYYFSRKSGVRQEKISDFTRNELKKQLNHFYEGVLRRSKY